MTDITTTFDTLPYDLQNKIMDMKNDIELQEELAELKRTPSHIDLPFINEYPIIKCPSRISIDIQFVNLMRSSGPYFEQDYINVIHYMLKIDIPPTTASQVHTAAQIYTTKIKKFINKDLGISDDMQQDIIMYRMLNKARNIRLSLHKDFHSIYNAYHQLFVKELKTSKDITLRFGLVRLRTNPPVWGPLNEKIDWFH